MSSCSADAHGAKPVECRAFLGIAQDLIRRVDLFEALLSTVVAGVFVRVMLRRKFAERALDFVLCRRTANTKNVVGIAHDARDSTNRLPFPASAHVSCSQQRLARSLPPRALHITHPRARIHTHARQSRVHVLTLSPIVLAELARLLVTDVQLRAAGK